MLDRFAVLISNTEIRHFDTREEAEDFACSKSAGRTVCVYLNINRYPITTYRNTRQIERYATYAEASRQGLAKRKKYR